MNNELALTESPSLRAQYYGRDEVLDRVQGFTLPDGREALTAAELASGLDGQSGFGVPVDTIRKLSQRHRAELEANGMRKATPDDEGIGQHVLYLSPAKMPWVYPRRAVLNMAMLLTGSEPARLIRTYLLDVEQERPSRRVRLMAEGTIIGPDDQPYEPYSVPWCNWVHTQEARDDMNTRPVYYRPVPGVTYLSWSEDQDSLLVGMTRVTGLAALVTVLECLERKDAGALIKVVPTVSKENEFFYKFEGWRNNKAVDSFDPDLVMFRWIEACRWAPHGQKLLLAEHLMRMGYSPANAVQEAVAVPSCSSWNLAVSVAKTRKRLQQRVSVEA